ncbi:hypothetical protein [Longimicrobium sp.]|uniref:hypothetical protein n=1 Tax=Longimicrobium sp. TaxID=2029185 RepID=UPI002ED7DD9A
MTIVAAGIDHLLVREAIMRNAFRRLLLVPGLALLAAGCGDLGEVLVLSRDIKREFAASDVSVNLQDGRSVEVSVWRDTPPATDGAVAPESDAMARRVAEYVRDHYAGYDRLAEVRVELKSRRGAAVNSYAVSDGFYVFARRELGPARK